MYIKNAASFFGDGFSSCTQQEIQWSNGCKSRPLPNGWLVDRQTFALHGSASNINSSGRWGVL